MFSNSFKKKIIIKYNISESIINRPIHYRIPDLVNMKLNSYPIDSSSKRIKNKNTSNDLEIYKTNSISPLSSRQRNIKKISLKKHNFKQQLHLLLHEAYPINIYFNKNRSKNIKMINDLIKFRKFSNNAVINNFINLKNHKQSTKFPLLFQNIKNTQKLTKINHMMPPNFFFTPQNTKIKNKYNRNQKEDIQLKESETNTFSIMETNMNKKEKSIDYDKYSIKIIKTYDNNGLINSNNITNNDDNNICSYDDDSSFRIRSRYFNANIINDEKSNNGN